MDENERFCWSLLRTYAEKLVAAVTGRTDLRVEVYPAYVFVAKFSDYYFKIDRECVFFIAGDVRQETLLKLAMFLDRQITCFEDGCYWEDGRSAKEVLPPGYSWRNAFVLEDKLPGYAVFKEELENYHFQDWKASHCEWNNKFFAPRGEKPEEENGGGELPRWLDDFIFRELGAKYCRSNSDMTVIDWDRSDVLNYLGTYFPRSYVEAVQIFGEFFKGDSRFGDKSRISVFDFGSGTGGEIIGLLTALEKAYPYLEQQVDVVALDGNQHALRLYEEVLEKFQLRTRLRVRSRVIPMQVDDLYDLSILNKVLRSRFDIIMSFKAICEFVTKQRFEEDNAYAHVARTLLPKLEDDGVMVLEDVSSYNGVSQEWLPRMMDAGLVEAGGEVIARNEGYNQTFCVSHSRKRDDISKVAWRIIQKMR